MIGEIDVCKTCMGTGIEYDGAGHTCTACNGIAKPFIPVQPIAWRGINCYGEVVTDWIDGVPGPMVDLSGNPASYDSLEYAYPSPSALIEIELPTVCASDSPHELKRDIIEILEAAGIKVKP